MEDNEMHHHPLLSPPAAAASPPATTSGASFTALLGLPPSRAVLELLHEPTFPSDPALVDRAARFSVFANVNAAPSPEVSPPPPEVGKKRKDGGGGSGGNGKAKAKKGKQQQQREAEEDDNTDGENNNKLPYVHVRARRGQATDSHSLAERARREKINARMKLLQELVPGCSKISGTALVLDEIINHVQYLQRQVEYLSMSLAAVNPRIDFSGLDNFISSTAVECGRLTTIGATTEVGVSGANQINNNPINIISSSSKSNLQQQFWHVDLLNTQNDHLLLHAFDRGSVNAVEAPIQSNQLKMEL